MRIESRNRNDSSSCIWIVEISAAMAEKKGKDDAATRSLIIGFEEPEIYLHPSAANQMRDLIYELSGWTVTNNSDNTFTLFD
ncbi:AAA family ATPase [Escherichia coli]|nr:AAA family ATPase [Escherichia coli]